ncbi:conserved oligomeric Golgi complex subunit 6-like isoform X2 [Convolutriloba macropyga]|uniref:conserved oligomeric Golgi complex subunit 6-like isoform X2 n=1 Tax=Convolutriloba macropyga TaxID=536237 RepID=UPI003F52700B
MQDELKRTKESTSSLMHRTNELNKEAKLLTMQQKLTEAFCKKFYLQPEEENLIRSKEFLTINDVPLLLSIIKKIRRIHEDAKVLLRANNQQTGLEIVERMGQFEEQSFEKLYRWAQRECRNLVSESPEINSLLVDALAALSERKTLLNYTMDEFCMVRKGVVSRGFIDALTRGSSASGPTNTSVKPIEMHAHDPVRYIGDMLAWIHQALAGERELVEMMLQKTNNSREEIGYFVAFSSEGLCRPLKVRLDHVIANDPDVITMFKIRALLKFYYSTFAESVSATSPLCTAMLENGSLFDKLFFSTLRTSLNSLCEQKESLTSDLSPSNAFEKMLVLLQQILHSYSTAFFDPKVKQQDFKALIDIIVSSLLQCLQQSAANTSTHADMSVYMMNSLHKAKTVLSIYEFTDDKIEMLSGQIDAHLDTFINEQVIAFLNSTDLMFAYNKQTSGDRKFSDSENERLKKAANNLDRLLSNPDQFMLTQSRLVSSATLREAAITRCQSYFAQLYGDLYKYLQDVTLQDLTELMRDPEQVKSLLV